MLIQISIHRMKRILAGSIFILCLIFSLYVQPAYAAMTWTVFNLNDVGIGSLRNTINNAAPGDTIVFQSGLTGTIVLSSQLTIDKSLRIIGPGTGNLTISGNNKSRIFKVTDGDVSISNLTIANGRAVGNNGHYGYDGLGGGGGGGGGATGGGGGMLIYGGTVTIDSVAFNYNSAIGGNGGHGGDGWEHSSPDGDGGAGGTSDLIPGSFGGYGGHTQNSKTGGDVVYGGNYSGGGGGYGGNANYNSYIGGGDAGSGGSAYDLAGRGGSGGNKANVTFYYNKAGYGGDGGQGGGGYGGAVALTGGSLYISNSTFTGNIATGGQGGAAGSSSFRLSGGLNWYFGGSGGPGGDAKGGAIFIGGRSIGNSTYYQPGTVRIVNSTFSGNTANPGTGGYAGSHVQVGNPGQVYANGIYNRSTIGYKSLTEGALENYAGNAYELSGPDAIRSTVTASVSSVSTDGGTANITVTLKDYGGNPVFGNKVTLIPESGTPSILPISASTDNNGQAIFTVGNKQAGTVTFSARDTTVGMTIIQKVNITFTPGQTNTGKSTVTASPSSLLANASDISTIIVTLRDINGNPVGSGKTVTLSQNGSSTIWPVSAVTDSEGQVTFAVKSNVAQTVTYTARNATDNVTLTQTAVVDFAPVVWSVSSLEDSLVFGTLRYAISNAPAGTAITCQSGLAGTILLESPLPAIGRDLVIDGLGADVIISGKNMHRVFEITGGTVSIKNLTVANGKVLGSNGQDGADGSTNYQYGYGFSGQPGGEGRGGGLLVTDGIVSVENVVFQSNLAAGGNGGNGGNGKGFGAPYDDGGRGGDGGHGRGGAVFLANGQLTITNSTFTGNGALGGHGGRGGNGTGVAGDGGHGGNGGGGAVFVDAGLLTINYSQFSNDSALGGNGGNGGQFGNITRGGMHGGNGGHGSGGAIYFTNGTMNLTGIQFSNESVMAGAVGTGNRGNGQPGSALGSDIYKQNGTIMLTNVNFDSGPNSYYNTAPAVVGQSTITVDVNQVNSGGVAFATIKVNLKDALGIPVGSGKGVTLSQGTGRSVISPAVANTDGNGIATFQVSNIYSETVTYTATNITDNFSLTQTVEVYFLPPDPDLSLMTASLSSVTADGSEASTITVTIRDVNGYPVPGKIISLSQGTGNSNILPASAVTNSDGQAIFSVTNGNVETVTYAAQNTTDGFTVPLDVTVTFTPYEWIVTSTEDTDTPGTLRHAINHAPAGTTIPFQKDLTGTITLTSQLPVINKNLTIDGAGANITISGNDNYRVFRVDGGAVSIRNLTIADGKTVGNGGTHGHLWNQNGGHAQHGYGGGLYIANGTVSVLNVIFSGNAAIGGRGGDCYIDPYYIGQFAGYGGTGYGGAIYLQNGTLTIERSQFDDNSGLGGNGGNTGSPSDLTTYGGGGGNGYGGAIFVQAGTLTVTDSQFANNAVTFGQGGMGRVRGSNGSALYEDLYVAGGTCIAQNVSFESGTYSYYNPIPAEAGHSTVTADPSSVLSDGKKTATITVRLKRADGNMVGSGKTVTLSASSATSSIVPVNNGVTDRYGTATFTVSDTASKTVTYTATDITDNVLIDQKVTVTFTPPGSEFSSITAGSTSVLANGSESAIITVIIKFANGDPAPGKTITLSQGTGHSKILPASAVTDINGQATFTVVNGYAETVTYTAQNVTDGFTVPQTVAVTYTPYEWVVNSLADTDTLGTLRHAINYAQGGKTITFQQDLIGTITLTDSLPAINKDLIIDASGVQVTINGNNQFRVFRVDGGTVSIRNLTIKDGRTVGGAGAPSIRDYAGAGENGTGGGLHITGGTVSVENVSFIGNTAVGGIGGFSKYGPAGNGGNGYGGAIYLHAGSLIVNNSNFDGNRVIGGNGANGGERGIHNYGGLAGNGGNGYGGAIYVNAGSLIITDSQFSNNTVAFGQGGIGNAYFGGHGSNGSALYEDLYIGGTCSISNVSFGSGDYSYYNSIPADAGKSTVNASPSSILSDGSEQSTITVTLKDAGGNSVGSGKTVSLSQGTGNSTIISFNNGLTNNNGTAIFTVTNTKAETVTYTAADTANNVTVTQTTTVNFISTDLELSTLIASSNSIPADGTSSSIITVTLKYANGNGAPGKTVTLSQGSGRSIITPASATTNSNGQATFTVFNSYNETVTYSAMNTTDNVAVIQTVKVTFLYTDPELSTVTASKSNVLSDGSEESVITVTLKYVNGIAAAGKTVTLSQGNGHSTISPVSATTNSDGQAIFTVVNSRAETITYTATDTTNNVTLLQTVTINFLYPDPELSRVTASQASVLSDGIEESIITVTLKYANGNGASGKTITLSQGSGHSTITPVSATTDSNGQATFTVVNTRAETVIYNAMNTTDNVSIPQTVTINFLSPDPVLSTVTASHSSVLADGVETSTITVTLRYANGNGASGKTVALSQGSGLSIISPVSAATDSNGQAIFTVINGKAETVSYTATDITDNMVLSQTATVTFTPYAWVINSLADTNVSGTLRYALNNTLPGATITFQNGLTGTILLGSSLPTINKDLTIDGTGSNITISGNNQHRVFQVDSGTVSIKNITVANGRVVGNNGTPGNFTHGGTGGTGAGAGLNVTAGTVSIDSVTFTGNRAIGGDGGMVEYYYGYAFKGGHGGNGYGGAIYLQAGSLTITNSQFSSNNAGGGNGNYAYDEWHGNGGNGCGGAIFVNDGSLTVIGSQFASNTVTFGTSVDYGYDSYRRGQNGTALYADLYAYGGTCSVSDVSFGSGTHSYFNSSPAGSEASTITVTPSSILVGGSEQAVITVTLRLPDGSMAGSNKRVSLSQGSGHSNLVPVNSGLTDNNGTATFTVTGTIAETVIYTATETTANVTLTQTAMVLFKMPPVTLTYIAGEYGSISGDTPQTVGYGEAGTAVTAVPDPGYNFVSWSDGVTTNPRIDGNVVQNISVTANFAKSYTVTVGTMTGGSITATPSTTGAGATITLSITPEAGKQLKAGSLKYNDGTDHAIIGTSFTMPAANVTVTAEFEEIPVVPPTTYTVTYSVDGGNGTLTATVDGESISPGVKIEEGKDVVFTATPNEGYRVKAWKLKETIVPNETGSSYTLINLQEAAIITVEFAAESAVISPIEATFDISNPTNISTTITWNFASTVTSVVYGDLDLSIDTDYLVSGNNLTIKEEYLNSLEPTAGETITLNIGFDIGNPATFTIQIVEEYIPGNDATLSDLQVNGITVTDFVSNIYNYTVELPFGTTAVPIISATANDTKATVAITPATNLSGETKVQVTAEDGETSQTYIVNFILTSDASGFATALAEPGNKMVNQTFTLSISSAKDVHGTDLNGNIQVTVTSNKEEGEVYKGNANFSNGYANVNITLTTVAEHNLTVEVAGVANSQSITLTVESSPVVILESIAITSPPVNTVYIAGESFNPNGMVVQATYSNGLTETVTGYTYTPSGALTTIDTKVIITYAGRTVEQAIIVNSQDDGGLGGGFEPPPVVPKRRSEPQAPGSLNTITLSGDALAKQTTVQGGKTVETFTLQATAVQQQLASARNEGKTAVEIKVETNQETTTVVNIPAAVLQNATDMTVAVSSQHATIELPSVLVAALAAVGQELSLTIERGEGEVVQGELLGVPQGEGAELVGTPAVIKTELKGDTTIALPLEGISLPEDPGERGIFLERLAVFIIHSDGEKILVAGNIVFDSAGKPLSIKFTVDRFSTFTLVKLLKPLDQTKVIQLTIGKLKASINDTPFGLEAAPFIDKKTNRTMVPLRFVSELLGARVEWQKEKQQVTISARETQMILNIGSDKVLVEGKLIILDRPAEILPPGRTFVPLRFISEMMGALVNWDEVSQTITINADLK